MRKYLMIHYDRSFIMSKEQKSNKADKKEPIRSPKERKSDKKAKK